MEIQCVKRPKWMEKLPKDRTPSYLPNRFFFQIIYGHRQSGKSNLIANVLSQLKDVYTNIYIFSPSSKSDYTFEHLDKTCPNIYLCDEPSPELIDHVFKIQCDNYKKYIARLKLAMKTPNKFLLDDQELNKPPPFTLFVLDDLSAEYQHYTKTLKTLAYQGRHHGCSVILTAHNIRCVPVGCRANSTSFCMFKLPKMEQTKWIEENSDLLPQEQLEALLHYATEEDYSFLYYSDHFPKKQRFRIKFG